MTSTPLHSQATDRSFTHPASARITDILTHHLAFIISNSTPPGDNHPSNLLTTPAVPHGDTFLAYQVESQGPVGGTSP